MKSIWRINVQWRRATGAASARQQGCQFLLCCRYITFWSFYCSRVVTLGYFWGSSKMFICVSVKLAPCPTIFHLFWVVKWDQMIGIQVLLRSIEMSCEHAWLATIWWRSCFRSWPNPLLLQFYIARRVEPQDISKGHQRRSPQPCLLLINISLSKWISKRLYIQKPAIIILNIL